MGTSREDIVAAIRAAGGYRELESQPEGVADVPFDQGPIAAGKQLWKNATGGTGDPMRLISSDGTARGVVEDATNTLGGSGYSKALRQGATIEGPKLGPEDIKFQPGVAGETSGTDLDVSGAQGGMQVSNRIRNHTLSAGPKGDGKALMPEAADYLTVGGPDSFKKAYEEDPALVDASIKEVGELEGKKHAALAQQYGSEAERAQQSMAAIQAKRQESDQVIQKKMADLESATTYYTNDLADKDKFWHSPGNIVAAISFSLMPIFSNDPAIGMKLINQAIDRDMANRKDLANMHLGELRTNLGAYRKLAEDRIAGDMLAEAEAHRVAAMQIERISQQYESPISKEKAMGLAAGQMQQADMMRNQAFNHFVYNQPKLVDPRIKSGYAQGVPGAMTPFGSSPERQQAQQNGAPVQGQPGFAARGVIGNSPSTASTTGPTPNLTPSQQQLVADPEQAAKAVVEGRIPGGMKAVDLAQQTLAIQASYRANGDMTPGNPKFEKAKDEIMDEAEGHIEKIREPMQKIAAAKNTIKRLSGDISIIEQSIPDPQKREEFMGGITRSMTPERFQSWYDNIQSKSRANPNNPVAMHEQAVADAAMRFRQLYMMDVSGYLHDMAGANQSEGEMARLNQVVRSDSSWKGMVNYVNNRSSQLKAEEASNIATLPSFAKLVYLASTGVDRGGAKVAVAPVKSPVPSSPTRVPDEGFIGPPR